MSRALLVAALALALSPVAASAQEYAVKLRMPGLGDRSKVKTISNFEVEFKLLDDGGNATIEHKETKFKKYIFTDVGLERAATGEELIRVKRHYEHAERKIKDVRETLPFQGKTVLIEKTKGRFHFQIEGDEFIEGKEAEDLNEEFNKGGLRKLLTEHFLPRKLVKVNEKWKIDVTPLAKAFTGDGNIELDASKSTGFGKLTKAYQKNAKQFGVVELIMEFPISQFTHEGAKLATKNSKITLQLQADVCIDGTVDVAHFTGSFRIVIRGEGATINGQNGTLAVTINATSDDVWTPIAK